MFRWNLLRVLSQLPVWQGGVLFGCAGECGEAIHGSCAGECGEAIHGTSARGLIVVLHCEVLSFWCKVGQARPIPS